MDRRHFLSALVGVAASGVASSSASASAALASTRPITPAEAFDSRVRAFMAARGIPGGALAVVKDRRIVYAQGYGWANREGKIRSGPDSLFRIASLSKPLTAVAIFKLVESGRLELESRMLDLLPAEPLLEESRAPDVRLKEITVRHLLQHTAGWDRDKSFDPMFRSRLIARVAGVRPPAGPETVIRYMWGRPLDFDPGTRFAYSNFGYCVLGRIIEKLSGQSYERFVQEHVLAPIGVERMRLGASLHAVDGEVRYYTTGDGQGDSVFPETPRRVPWPYGGFDLEAMDAHGGWIASAVDLARFAAALDDRARSPLLRPATFELMYAPPPPPASRRADGTLEDRYYCCGWMVRRVGTNGPLNYWHSGSLPGTSTLLVRRWDGLSWVALFNQRSEDKKLPDSDIDVALHHAADGVTAW